MSKARRPRYNAYFTADGNKRMTAPIRKEHLANHGQPSVGDLRQCPIHKRISIAYVNAKIAVARDPKTGNPRGPICDQLQRWTCAVR